MQRSILKPATPQPSLSRVVVNVMKSTTDVKLGIYLSSRHLEPPLVLGSSTRGINRGDVLLCVNGQPAYGHEQASKLLSTACGNIQLLVCDSTLYELLARTEQGDLMHSKMAEVFYEHCATFMPLGKMMLDLIWAIDQWKFAWDRRAQSEREAAARALISSFCASGLPEVRANLFASPCELVGSSALHLSADNGVAMLEAEPSISESSVSFSRATWQWNTPPNPKAKTYVEMYMTPEATQQACVRALCCSACAFGEVSRWSTMRERRVGENKCLEWFCFSCCFASCMIENQRKAMESKLAHWHNQQAETSTHAAFEMPECSPAGTAFNGLWRSIPCSCMAITPLAEHLGIIHNFKITQVFCERSGSVSSSRTPLLRTQSSNCNVDRLQMQRD